METRHFSFERVSLMLVALQAEAASNRAQFMPIMREDDSPYPRLRVARFLLLVCGMTPAAITRREVSDGVPRLDLQ